MAWWYSLNQNLFIRYHSDTVKQRPVVYPFNKHCPASHLVSSRVSLPFTLTLNDYSAFLALCDAYLESKETVVPIDTYMLGSTVLLWHSAIWNYIGQMMNMLCDRPRNADQVNFERATDLKLLRLISEEQIFPIKTSTLIKLATSLRSIRGSTDSGRRLRNIHAHEAHIANTYSPKISELIQLRHGESEQKRLRLFRKTVTRSFSSLIKAEKEFKVLVLPGFPWVG